MGTSLTKTDIQQFLINLGQKINRHLQIYLLGGSALCLLGSQRNTRDIDFVQPIGTDNLRTLIEQFAESQHIDIELIDFSEFIPIPPNADERHLKIGDFGLLEIFIFDPHSIVLSKVARGFKNDFKFLIQNGHV
jgi:hypothetical protein